MCYDIQSVSKLTTLKGTITLRMYVIQFQNVETRCSGSLALTMLHHYTLGTRHASTDNRPTLASPRIFRFFAAEAKPFRFSRRHCKPAFSTFNGVSKYRM